MISINLKPDLRILRQFGVISLFGFAILAWIAWNEWLFFSIGLGVVKVPLIITFSALGVLSGVFALFWPKGNLPLYMLLTLVSFPIGFVLSYAIMGLFFYGILTPVGMIFLLLGRDSMERRFNSNAHTYWVDARPPRSEANYFKQF